MNPEDQFRRVAAEVRQLVSDLRRHHPPMARLSSIRDLSRFLEGNDQNDPDNQDETDPYPDDSPMEHHNQTEDTTEWIGEVSYNRGTPDYDFKWGSKRVRPCEVLRGTRLASTPDDIVSGLNRGVAQRSQNVNIDDPSYRRRFQRWEVEAYSGGPTYTVEIEADTNRDVVLMGDAFWDTDVYVRCSCPYWRWNGPEYHADSDDYLKGSPRGTASTPDTRDPERNRYVCKHVYRVFEEIRDRDVGQRNRR
jgi:hypothetical protein